MADIPSLRRTWLWLCCLLSCWTWTPAPAQEALVLDRAQFVVWPGDEPPPPEAPWREVRLTHRWSASDYDAGLDGWYRLTVTFERPPETLWGVYLPIFNLNVGLWVNGDALGASGPFRDPLPRNWNRPFYRHVPASLWRAGENELLIHLATYPIDGNLGPVWVGPNALLEPRYEWQMFFQVEISEALFPITLAVGFFSLGLWLRRRHDTQYLWFGASVLCWSVFSLNMFIENPPLPAKWWEWLAHSSLDWWVVLFVIFCFRFSALRKPRVERALLAWASLASVSYAWVDLTALMAATRLFHGGSLVIGFYAIAVLVGNAWRHRDRRQAALAAGLSVLLLLGIHDWVLQFKVFGAAGTTGFHLHHYFSPLIFLALGWHLTRRFVTALNEAERLNRELERRIDAARREIEAHYRTIEAMERHRAVAQERERLSREIHDGIGGAISNAIMLTELVGREREDARRTARLGRLREQLQGALDEMRGLILTLEEDLFCVRDLASHIHERCEKTLPPLGIAYEGEIRVQSEALPLSRQQSLNLLRIFQEGLNNVVKHAHARQVRFQVTEEDGEVRFALEDDGVGFDPCRPGAGYGRRNMARRAADIGAQLQWESRPGAGTRLTVRLRPAA